MPINTCIRDLDSLWMTEWRCCLTFAWGVWMTKGWKNEEAHEFLHNGFFTQCFAPPRWQFQRSSMGAFTRHRGIFQNVAVARFPSPPDGWACRGSQWMQGVHTPRCTATWGRCWVRMCPPWWAPASRLLISRTFLCRPNWFFFFHSSLKTNTRSCKAHGWCCHGEYMNPITSLSLSARLQAAAQRPNTRCLLHTLPTLNGSKLCSTRKQKTYGSTPHWRQQTCVSGLWGVGQHRIREWRCWWTLAQEIWITEGWDNKDTGEYLHKGIWTTMENK